MAAPANDTCATATVIAALPFTATVDVTDATSGDGPSCDPSAEHSIWYAWTAPDATPIKITASDSREWGTVVAVTTGACGTLTEVFCDAPLGSPTTRYLVPTASVPYHLQLALYAGVLGAFPSATITLDVTVAAVPTPVLTGTSTTGRTVTLTWAALTDTTLVYTERSLDGVAWTPVTSVGAAGPYHDRDLASTTLYHHRVRAWETTLGYGPYSNIVTTTTLGPGTGVVQYAFAVGAVGGFGRMQTRLEDGGASGYPATLEIYGVCQLWGVANPQETQPGGAGTTIFATSKLQLQYQTGATTTIVNSGYVLATQNQVPFPPPPSNLQVQYANVNHAIDVFGLLGSADTLTGTHRADGFITLVLDGVTIIDVHDLALGTTGTPGWSNVRIQPAGTLTFRAPDGAGIDQNGGLASFTLGTQPVEGASDVFDYTFAGITDEQLYGTAGSWLRYRGSSGSSTEVPTVWGGRLSDSSAATGFATGWMQLKGTHLIPPPTLWPPDGPPEPPDGGGGDTDAPPHVAPSYHLDARYIRRLRRAPHVAQEHSRVFYRRFELDLERGQGLASGQGADPMVLLRISRDGGQTWGEEIRMGAGKLGEYTARVIARRLGQARDTVFEVVVSDPVAWSLVGAWLDLEAGTN